MSLFAKSPLTRRSSPFFGELLTRRPSPFENPSRSGNPPPSLGVSFSRQMPLKPIAPAARAAFGRRLRAWYRRNHRDLPWRKTRDPYRVLVSELMLQQTQRGPHSRAARSRPPAWGRPPKQPRFSRVLEFYARFIERFPTMQHLAD